MRAYDRLTPRGRVRRMAAVARAALERWPIAARRVRLLADATNVTWRVDADDGTRWALRISRPDDFDPGQDAAEIGWMRHLAAHHPKLGAPAPLASRAGRFCEAVSVAGVPGVCRCMVVSWVPGVTPGRASTVADHRRLGALMARMHAVAEGFTPADDWRPMRWDRVVYMPHDREVLFAPACADVVPAARVPMLRAAWDRCEALLAEVMASDACMVLHGDLHPWNVHRVRNRLRPLDFGDLLWGPPIQDVAVSLFYLIDRDDYPELCDAFAEGYCSVRAWPKGDMATIVGLQMARELMFCNYIARTLPEYRSTLPRRYEILARWMGME